MFLPALVFLCAAIHHVGRARSGTLVHRADVASVVAAWLVLPSALLACFASPCREGRQAWVYDDALAHVTLVALFAVCVVLVNHAFSWWAIAREARRWRRGEGPSRAGLDFGLGEDWVRAVPAEAPYRAANASEVLAFGSPAAAAAAIRWNFAALLAVVAALGSVTWLSLAARGAECALDDAGAEPAAMAPRCGGARHSAAYRVGPRRAAPTFPEWGPDLRPPALLDLGGIEPRSPRIEIWGRQPVDIASAPEVDPSLPSWDAPADRFERPHGPNEENRE